MAISLSTYYLGVDLNYSKSILDKDIRINIFSESLEFQLPTEIKVTGEIDNEQFTWIRDRSTRKGITRQSGDTRSIIQIAKSHQNKVRNNEDVTLPLLSYYGTSRLWKEKKSIIKTSPKSSRYDGYMYSLDAESSSKAFLSKMKTWELGVLQKKIDQTPLTLIKAAVGCFLEGYESIFFDLEADTIMLKDIHEENFHRISHTPWNILSDGYRNVIAMAADVAYRCVTLNPHLKEYATQKTKGVVLIDEIDLHLHPKWQKTIVNSFKKAFPEIQFITTTHSPFIIQSLMNEELFDLQGKILDTDYFRKSIEEISKEEMGIETPRSARFNEMVHVATEYFNLIKAKSNDTTQDEINILKQRLDELQAEFNEDPAFVALLNAERDKANLD